MRLGLIGTGRLGLCFALLAEKAGYRVFASDVREDYISNLCTRKIETNEPGVKNLLEKSRKLYPTTDNEEVIKCADLIYTLVATPSLDDGSYDVSAVWNVIDDFKKCDFDISGKALVVGCTTNPGDCEKFQDELAPYGVEVYYNPEFITQGNIIKDLVKADMVLLGGRTGKNRTPEGRFVDEITDLYEDIQLDKPNIHKMSTKAAEFTKIAVNCFLTTKISFANLIGEAMTLDKNVGEIPNVLAAIGDDTRIGNKYLKFGFGFGGPCLPRDNRAFAAYVEKLGLEHNLGKVTDEFNNNHHKFLVDQLIASNVNKNPFAFQTAAYKNETDILTESQQYKMCLEMLDRGYEVYIIDEMVKGLVDERIKFGVPEGEVYLVAL